MKTASIVIPVYENQGSLPLLFDRLQEVALDLKQHKASLEVIFVNDGSTDNSWQIIQSFLNKDKAFKIKALSLSRNFGAMAAIKAGLSRVSGDAFTLLSADLQDPPELIPDMVKAWQTGEKFIICCRRDRKDPMSSKLFSGLFYFFATLLIDKHFPRGGFDIFFLDKCFLKTMQQMGPHINIPFFVFYLKRNHPYKCFQYDRQEREHGKSKWRFWAKVKLMLDSFLAFSGKPMRFISILGSSVALISFLYAVVLIWVKLAHHQHIPGYTSTMVVMCFLLGLIILMLGAIGEYLYRMYDGFTKKPEFVIQDELE